MYVERERQVEIECVQNDGLEICLWVEIESECIEIERVCVWVKRDIKGPLLVRVKLGFGYGLGYQAFCLVFHFLTFCSLAFCSLASFPGFVLVYTAEIRGQPLVYVYIYSLFSYILYLQSCAYLHKFWRCCTRGNDTILYKTRKTYVIRI